MNTNIIFLIALCLITTSNCLSLKTKVNMSLTTTANFLQTCNKVSLEKTNILYAYCQRMDGSWRNTKLNLDECIANIDGTMKWIANGSFSLSVSECSLSSGILTCKKTKDMKGVNQVSSYNLNSSIDNTDGYLICDRINSTKRDEKPIIPVQPYVPGRLFCS